ncbi:MAG: beta-phosphoglucomutase family hydrolase [Candidatus Omnitrophica bacterium]|nr:beta-phosphoglucomutase family hydrolase [Candidatus Omnitrophota bacterium]MDD5429346.1 beta-phosphoglucomutase family hydrolase [Candidatus Omnitrophota bacterium]
MSFKGAIFDLDGVIVNTVPLHFKAWQKMFREYGKDINFEDYKNKVDGIPRIDGARAILTQLSPPELEKAASLKQDYFLELLNSQGVEVYQSTLDLIILLKEESVKIAAISSSKNCLSILRQVKIIDLFEAIITGKDGIKGKPAPDIFLAAAERLGLRNEGCVVFEDAVLGVEAAKKASMKCVGIDRYDSPQRLSKADIVVSDLSEIGLLELKGLFL